MRAEIKLETETVQNVRLTRRGETPKPDTQTTQLWVTAYLDGRPMTMEKVWQKEHPPLRNEADVRDVLRDVLSAVKNALLGGAQV